MSLKEIRPGAFAGDRFTPISSVALYVPRGKGAFPSVTMMTTGPRCGCRRAGNRDRHPARAGRHDRCGHAGRGAALRRRDRLQMRRRAGGGGRGLWHRDGEAGRQDRRPRQPLGGRRQERSRLGDRHRPSRRAVGIHHPRRRQRRRRARRARPADRSRARAGFLGLSGDAQRRGRRGGTGCAARALGADDAAAHRIFAGRAVRAVWRHRAHRLARAELRLRQRLRAPSTSRSSPPIPSRIWATSPRRPKSCSGRTRR